MGEAHRREVFENFIWQSSLENLTPEKHLSDVKAFYDDSIKGIYYQPFAMDSKNYRDIPEKTKQWFNALGDLLDLTCILAEKGEKEIARSCFEKLFTLIEKMTDEIVFAHELGDWMLVTRYNYKGIYEEMVG